jgi:hypothetical protein
MMIHRFHIDLVRLSRRYSEDRLKLWWHTTWVARGALAKDKQADPKQPLFEAESQQRRFDVETVSADLAQLTIQLVVSAV